MRTPKEFESIALWMGWLPCEWRRGIPVRWIAGAGNLRSSIKKTSLTPAECYEALGRMVEKGYEYRYYYTKKHGHDLSVWPENKSVVMVESLPTPSDCIEAAILALVEAEKGGA
ncbi:hypothetical protein CCP3SC15_2010005 [Gammaproteobacteria bacterium]